MYTIENAKEECKIAQEHNIIMRPELFSDYPEIQNRLEKILELSKEIKHLYKEIQSIQN